MSNLLTTNTVNIRVNNKKPSANGNINIVIDDIPDLRNTIDGSSYLNINQPTNNQGLIYNSVDEKFENAQIDHTSLNNVGTNTHDEIDSFINTIRLDENGKISTDVIPDIALTSITTVNTLVERNQLTNIQSGDVCVVINDDININNNGSYIYTGSSWVRLSMYITKTNLSELADVNLSNLTTNDILKYNGFKWANGSLDLSPYEKTINKGTTYCGLDGNQLISTSNIPDLSESKITNLTSNLSACEKKD